MEGSKAYTKLNADTDYANLCPANAAIALGATCTTNTDDCTDTHAACSGAPLKCACSSGFTDLSGVCSKCILHGEMSATEHFNPIFVDISKNYNYRHTSYKHHHTVLFFFPFQPVLSSLPGKWRV